MSTHSHFLVNSIFAVSHSTLPTVQVLYVHIEGNMVFFRMKDIVSHSLARNISAQMYITSIAFGFDNAHCITISVLGTSILCLNILHSVHNFCYVTNLIEHRHCTSGDTISVHPIVYRWKQFQNYVIQNYLIILQLQSI